tara:strand:+ start:2141 stop:2314 length:174 start_codon:yes stop_codon:yes gene_type:complete
MNLNKITYDKIRFLMLRICLMNNTEENIKIFSILDKVKENSSYTYKELLNSKLNQIK